MAKIMTTLLGEWDVNPMGGMRVAYMFYVVVCCCCRKDVVFCYVVRHSRVFLWICYRLCLI